MKGPKAPFSFERNKQFISWKKSKNKDELVFRWKQKWK